MIETTADCNRFQKENSEGDWILHLIPVDEDIHPVVNRPSILFIRNVFTKKTYYFAFEHPDSVPIVTHSWFILEYIIKSKNKKWVLDKKGFTQMLNLPDVCDSNLLSYIHNNEVMEIINYETPAHFLVRKNSGNFPKVNLAIPLLKHKEMFDELANDITRVIEKCKTDEGYSRFNDLIIGTLGRLERGGIFVDRERFKRRFGIEINSNDIVYSKYNVYTATGRPSNAFDGINYSALNHEDGTRKCFRSRYGNDGCMVVIDYATFHPRIISYLTKYDISISTDIYEYLAKLYFHKSISTDIDDIDIKNAKKLTFRQFFGGVEKEYEHIKYLANLKSFITEQWEFFQKNGYVLTPLFKRKITDRHITDPDPPKVFNYILQAVEGEIAIPRMKLVMDYLMDRKSKCILYTYDSILIDFHKEDGINTLNEIRKIMSYDGMFPMKTYIGETYHDVKLMSL
jgi:hypothetical protein